MSLTLRDPLAELFGAAEGGLLSYAYADAVKLAGHSCPTVAGAYRATCDALRRLYPGETPVRGAVRVELRGAAHDGAVGTTRANPWRRAFRRRRPTTTSSGCCATH